MSNLAALGLSMGLLLGAYPLVSLGATRDSPILWALGLAALAAGGLIPPARRFVSARREKAAAGRAGLCDDCRVS